MYYVLKDTNDDCLTYLCVYINDDTKEAGWSDWGNTVTKVLSSRISPNIRYRRVKELLQSVYLPIMKAETLEELKLVALLER